MDSPLDVKTYFEEQNERWNMSDSDFDGYVELRVRKYVQKRLGGAHADFNPDARVVKKPTYQTSLKKSSLLLRSLERLLTNPKSPPLWRVRVYPCHQQVLLNKMFQCLQPTARVPPLLNPGRSSYLQRHKLHQTSL